MVLKNLIIAGVLFFSSFSYSCVDDFETVDKYSSGSEVDSVVIHLMRYEGWFSNDYVLCRYAYRDYGYQELAVRITEEDYNAILGAEDPFRLSEIIIGDAPRWNNTLN